MTKALCLFALFCATRSFAADAKPPESCKGVIGEVALYQELAKDPYFAHGVPPPGKQMRVEREACGYRVYVGTGSPDSLAGDLLMVNGEGRITQLVSRP